jgi:hypothetical protein
MKEPLFQFSDGLNGEAPVECSKETKRKKGKKEKERESDAPTQTIIAMRAPLANVVAVDDDDDEPEVVDLA